MKTILYLSASTLLVGFAFWAYQVNYDTQEAVRRVDDLRITIAREREAISVLNAEWAYLNRPDRLRKLAEAHFQQLGLMPMTAEHFIELEAVPEPRGGYDKLVAEAVADSVDAALIAADEE